MPRISIIVPTYKNALIIEETLKAIFEQTFQDFEIIVVDDDSPDQTAEIFKKYQSHIKFIYQEHQGAPVARNRGFKESNPDSEFIIFCDGDLQMKPTMLEKMVKALDNNPDKSYAYCSFKFGFKKFKLNPFDAQKLKNVNYIHSSSLIRRKDYPPQGWDESLNKFQDWDLWLTMLEQGREGIWIDEVLFIKPNRKKHNISSWLPKIFYKIPWLKFGIKIKSLEKYQRAKEIIFNKHHLG